jgi:hypothetical protein
MKAKETRVARGASHFITKAGASPILSPIIKVCARPILPRRALVCSSHVQGFGLLPYCVFLPSFFNSIFDRSAPPWPKLVSDRFFGPLVG